jgi:hypothetical protein
MVGALRRRGARHSGYATWTACRLRGADETRPPFHELGLMKSLMLNLLSVFASLAGASKASPSPRSGRQRKAWGEAQRTPATGPVTGLRSPRSRPTALLSVPPAIAGGVDRDKLSFAPSFVLIKIPPAIAGGTDFVCYRSLRGPVKRGQVGMPVLRLVLWWHRVWWRRSGQVRGAAGSVKPGVKRSEPQEGSD